MVIDHKEEPFVSFKCLDCGEQVNLFDYIDPGKAGIIKCGNCDITWVVYCPSLIIKKANDIPQKIQEKVWQELQDNPIG